MTIDKQLQRRNEELTKIKALRERNFAKLMRAARAIEKLNKREKYLLTGRRNDTANNEDLKHKWHDIRHNDFDDTEAILNEK